MGCTGCENEWSEENLCILKVPIFNHLSVAEMEEIIKCSMQKKYKKKEPIFDADEPSKHLFIVHKGSVKIYRLSDKGKEQIIRVLTQGDFAGELSLFSQINSSCYAEALEDTEICMISQNDMSEIIYKYPSISLKMLEELSHRLNQMEKHVEEINGQLVEGRIADYLIHLANKGAGNPSLHPIKVTLPISKKDLASYMGTTRETLSRTLSRFQQNGWIRLDGKDILIFNDQRLRDQAN